MGDDTVVRSAGKATGSVARLRLAADNFALDADSEFSTNDPGIMKAILALRLELRALALLIEKQVKS